MASEPEEVGGGEQRLVQVRASGGRTKRQNAAIARGQPPPGPRLQDAFDELPPKENEPSIGKIDLTADGLRALQPPTIEGTTGTPSPPAPAPGPASPPDFSDLVLRTLDDLMGAFPIGSTDDYYITVERKSPVSYMGQATRGILRPIRRRLTLGEFIDVYGGGTYDLIVYGPPKRGGIPDDHTGRPRPTAKTKPVRIVIPSGREGGHPPNLEAAFFDEDEDSNMTMGHERNGGGGGALPFGISPRGVTPATAQVVKHTLDHEETMDERRRRERIERREERRREEAATASTLSRVYERREQELAAENRRLREERERERRKPGTDLDGVANLIGTLNPRASRDELDQLKAMHQSEIERIERNHKQELDNIRRAASDERERIQATAREDVQRAHTQLMDEKRRADERVTELERRMERSEQQAKSDLDKLKRDLDQSHEQALSFTRAEHAREVKAIELSHSTLLESERRAHAREIEIRDTIAQSKLDGEVARRELTISGLKSDLARRDREAEELKKLADKNKDLGKLLEDAKRMAELVGYAPRDESAGGEPPDWKSTAMTAIVEGAKNLPAILQSATNAIGQVRGAQPQPQPQQHALPPPGYPVPQQFAQRPYVQQRPPVFATESSGIEPTSGPESFAPERRGVLPTMPEPVQYAPSPPSPSVAPAPPQPALPPSAPPPMPQAAEPQVRQVQQAPAPPAAQPPARAPATVQPSPELDAIVMNARERLLEAALERGQPPGEVASLILGSLPADQIRAYLPALTPEYVVGALRRSQTQSRLASRAGQRFLGEIHAALKKALG